MKCVYCSVLLLVLFVVLVCSYSLVGQITPRCDYRYHHNPSANPTLSVHPPLLYLHCFGTIVPSRNRHQTTTINHAHVDKKSGKPKDQEEYIKELNISNKLLNNLCTALQSASIDKSSTKHANIDHPAKRMKLESGVASASTDEPSRDAYNILDPSVSKGVDIVHVTGAIIARLTIGGLINALAGQPGGVVDTTSAKSLDGSEIATKKETPIATAQNATMGVIQAKSQGLSHLVGARLEVDMMQSTPKRIVEMLCPELTISEIAGVRRRIYDTVILGKGTNASANAEALENKDELPVAARTGMHDIDKVSYLLCLAIVTVRVSWN
jgi:hypothetical protein